MTLINPSLRNKLRPGPNPIAFAKLIVALNQKPCSRADIVEQVGITEATATRWLNLLKQENLIYVAYWRKVSNQPVAHWLFGYMVESEPRPKPKTGAELCKDYRLRKLVQKQEELAKAERARRKPR